MDHRVVANHIVSNCGNVNKDEKILVLCDASTEDIADLFVRESQLYTEYVSKLVIPVAKAHGEEPPIDARELMLQSDLILSLCKYSLAHSQARIDAGKAGARFLSMPLYSWDLLNDPAMLVDYRDQYTIVRKVADLFTTGSRVHVFSKSGTNITLDIRDRVGNCCPGFVMMAGDLGSPPDIEANVSPIENNSYGKVVIDGSITCPDLGLLSTDVILDVEGGMIKKISSSSKEYVAILEKIFIEHGSKSRVLAECGIGLNPKAKLTGSMLTDEGALGCLHFGFGSNYTVGGRNEVNFHLDFVFKEASLRIDETDVLINGDLVL